MNGARRRIRDCCAERYGWSDHPDHPDVLWRASRWVKSRSNLRETAQGTSAERHKAPVLKTGSALWVRWSSRCINHR